MCGRNEGEKRAKFPFLVIASEMEASGSITTVVALRDRWQDQGGKIAKREECGSFWRLGEGEKEGLTVFLSNSLEQCDALNIHTYYFNKTKTKDKNERMNK